MKVEKFTFKFVDCSNSMVGKTNCLEIKIKWYFGNCPSNCLESTPDQTLAQCSKGVCCLLVLDALRRTGLPVAVTAQVSGSPAPVRAGLCCVCCWGTLVWAAVAMFVLFSPTRPGCVYLAKGCLADCGTIITASMSCPYNLFIARCVCWIFLKEKDKCRGGSTHKSKQKCPAHL